MSEQLFLATTKPKPSLNAFIRAQWQQAGSGFTARDGIVRLWHSFPSLADIPTTPNRWNAEEVVARLPVMSSGQRDAAAFVLMVWNGPLCREHFQLDRAMACWDKAHSAAFIDWCSNPWFP